MKYAYSSKWTDFAREIATVLELNHINQARIAVIESKGSKTRNVVARIHTMGKVMQLGLGEGAFYTIELLTEKFDKQNGEEKIKTIIHELMHIPASFGGGFRHHKDYVTTRAVEKEFNKIKHLYT